MAKNKKKIAIIQEGHLVVKNKKFKKSDILAFCVCFLAALVIWIYATNVEMNDTKKLEQLQEELQTTQTA